MAVPKRITWRLLVGGLTEGLLSVCRVWECRKYRVLRIDTRRGSSKARRFLCYDEFATEAELLAALAQDGGE